MSTKKKDKHKSVSTNSLAAAVDDRKNDTKCVVCRWGDRKGLVHTQELIRPCHCTREDHLYYHYQCLADLIIKTMDTPCKGCDRHFKDSRIVRDPNQLTRYLRHSPITMAYILVMAVLWLAYLVFIAYRLYQSYQILCRKHNCPHPIQDSSVALFVSLVTTISSRYVYRAYNEWHKREDRIIHFHQWKGTNNTYVFNLSEAKRQYVKKHK